MENVMKTKAAHTQKEGFSLVVIMFFLMVMSTMLAMLCFSASQRAYTSTRLVDEIKAKAMAEAGCEYAYAILSEDWEARNDPTAFPEESE